MADNSPPTHNRGTLSKVGAYEIVSALGSGTTGTVYRARKAGGDRAFALRVSGPAPAGDRAGAERFLADARAAAQVASEHLCRIEEVGEADGIPFIASEFVEGQSLERMIADARRPAPDLALDFLRQAALALQAMHDFGMCHGNIKPSNLLVADGRTLKVADFGVRRPPGLRIEELPLGVAGAPFYAAPEIVRGQPEDIRSDIYAIGACVYHLLAGKPPFAGPTATAVLMKHAGETLVPANAVAPDVGAPVSALLARMLAKAPADRPRTPGDLLTMILAARTGEPLDAIAPAPPVPPPAQPAATGAEALPDVIALAPPLPPSPSGAAARPRAGGRTTRTARRVWRRRQFARARTGLVVGGLFVVALVVAGALMRGREDPAVLRADAALTRARALLDEGSKAGAHEASRLARDACGGLPGGPAGDRCRAEADAVVLRAERRLYDLHVAEVGGRLAAARGDAAARAELKMRLDEIERTYAGRQMPQAERARMTSYLATVRADLAAAVARAGAQEKVAESRPAGTKAVRDAAFALAAGGKHAAALALVEKAVESAHNESERRLATDLRSDLQIRASLELSSLMRAAKAEMQAGRRGQARAALEARRDDFAIAPFDRRLAELIDQIDASAGVGADAPPAVQGPASPAPAAAPSCTIIVRTVPPGALVRVDGLARGTTPTSVSGLAPGAHDVLVVLDGYEAAGKSVALVAGRTAEAVFTLVAKTSPAEEPRRR